MKGHKSRLRRGISAVVCVLLSVTIGLFSSGGVLAITSLPHIEEIVSNSGSFNILEIVPKDGSGSIGYYAAGQEPLKDFYDLLAGKTDQNSRAQAAHKVFTDLQNRGLLGDGTDTPLKRSGDEYMEKKPWELSSGESSAMTKLTLKTPAQATATGTFQNSSAGDYDKWMNLAVGSQDADQVQKINSFQYASADPGAPAGTCYYYSPAFTPLARNASLPDCTAVYENAGDGTFSYVGSWGSGLTLDTSVTYYTVSDTGQPYASWDAAHPYAAASGDFTQVDKGRGYFTLAGYTYAGAGAGHYSFAPSPDGPDSAVIRYDTIWFSLGCRNSDWFVKYVFDQVDTTSGDLTDAGSRMAVKVKSETPGEVTAPDVQSAQLIVLSAGFDRSTGGNLAASYGAGNDIDGKGSGNVYDAIADADTAKAPIAVDSALVSGAAGTNIASLAKELKGEHTGNSFVGGNRYFFTGALATKAFKDPLPDGDTAGFSDVLAEIENENFLRRKDDPDTQDLLPADVTMANSIRYIVNYAGQRTIGAKKKLTVLDLEPGRGSDQSDASAQKADKVWEWLGGEDSGIKSSDIKIVTMSTSEFIGKIDDLVETYDMIYVGSDLTGFNTTGANYTGTTVYNDSEMDGLVYTNIGDTYRSNILLSGLLDRDYYADRTWTYNGKQYPYIDDTQDSDATKFRFSGNDLTQSKAGELEDFAKSGYPVVVSDNLLSNTCSFGASVSASKASRIAANEKVVLTASVTGIIGSLPADRAYQWYKGGSAIGGAMGSTCSVTAEDAAVGGYSCKVTIGGATAASGTITLSKGRHSSYSFSGGGAGDPAFYTPGGGLAISTARVDRASRMYSALSSISALNSGGSPKYNNVMSASAAQTNPETLRRYANLSKPQIEWVPPAKPPFSDSAAEGYPTEYSMDQNGGITSLAKESDGNYYLRYSFSISNETDATPETTAYDCRLFLDLNADGLYKANEQITDIVIRDSGGHLISPARAGNNTYRYALKAGLTYTVTRQMPSSYTGVLSWKLEVVKNDNEYIHASAVNYTHIAVPDTAKTNLNVLQIMADDRKGMDLTTNPTYQKLFPQVKDFNIHIDTITADTLDHPDKWINYTDKTGSGTKYGDLPGFLNSYNMLILGFNDEYQELSPASAQAVVNYIGTGKAVLFTHDTTSLSNIQKAYQSSNSIATAVAAKDSWYYKKGDVTSSKPASSGNPDYWGYYFNTLLRDAVKLDRYGVTNKTYGVSRYSTVNTSYHKAASGPVAAGPLDLTNAELLNGIKAAGYTIAYQPDGSASPSSPLQAAGETQGFTNYSLVRWPDTGSQSAYRATTSTYGKGRETTTVSQVNKGQITTYPFNVNTADFGGSAGGGNYMTVSNTHEQYYQLNLNSDKIVVWYCLSNGSNGNAATDYYAPLPNDVVNSYYIFSCGNVTYSGAGHSGGSVTDSEAKLFINTMIASYRSAGEKPAASFTNDASGDGAAQCFFLTSDYNAAASPNGTKTLTPSGEALNAASKIHFKITDPSLQENKDLALTFYYRTLDAKTGGESAARTFKTVPAVYNADTSDAAASYSGGLVYDIQLPDEIQNALKDSGSSAVNLYVHVYYKTDPSGSDPDPGKDAKIQIRQIGLFSLG